MTKCLNTVFKNDSSNVTSIIMIHKQETKMLILGNTNWLSEWRKWILRPCLTL